MSDYREVVETSEDGKLRAIIVVDSDAQKPDWDAQTPILQVETDYYVGWKATAFNSQAEEFEHAFNTLVQLGGYPTEVFERYLRIFHGTTVLSSWNLGVSREYGYVAFDTAAWREEMGALPENLKEEDLLEEVRAWAEGDCWGVGLERLVTWSTEDEDFSDFDDWEELLIPDQGWYMTWGYYGHTYATDEAKALLKSYLDQQK